MNINRKLLVVALATAMPWMSASAQSAADLQHEIEMLKGQLKMLSEKIEAMNAKPDSEATAQQITRLEQKMDLAEENTVKSGLKGITVKGSMEAVYQNDSTATVTGFKSELGNGGYGAAMLEVGKVTDDGVGWMLRAIPLSGTGSKVHEATVSVPIGEHGAKLNAGLTPDYSGYEYSMGNLNPLVSNNLLYSNLAASNYLGAGMSYVIGNLTAKWMVGQVDGVATRKAPGIAYRGDYAMGEYAGLGFSGVHVRTNAQADAANADLMEVDGFYNRGDLSLQGQFSFGRVLGGAMDGSGSDAKWWGLSGFAGYKLMPRLQAIARLDYINNRSNGGGVYYNDGSYGPELDNTGTVIDPSVGANRYALTLGTNYVLNANTQWKAELRTDRSSGYNFVNTDGTATKSKTTLGTSIVVSF